MIIVVLFILDVILAATANLLLKKGAAILKDITFSPKEIPYIITATIKNPYLVLGLIAYAFTFVLWILVLSRIKLSLAYPISVSLAIVLITIGSLIFYKEHISFLQILAILIIIVGIFLLLTK